MKTETNLWKNKIVLKKSCLFLRNKNIWDNNTGININNNGENLLTKKKCLCQFFVFIRHPAGGYSQFNLTGSL